MTLLIIYRVYKWLFNVHVYSLQKRKLCLFYGFRNGAKMSGVFCVVANMMEEIKTNQDVDVFRSVRLVRTNRPQFIGSVVSIK